MTDIGTAVEITNIERTNLDSFQKSYYENDEVEARFYPHSRKIGWNNNMEIRLDCKKNKEGEYTIEISKQFHFIKGLYMVVELPKIEVADKYKNVIKLAWTGNLLHHIHGEATLSIKKKAVCKLFPRFLDVDRVTRVEDVYDYDANIGNKKSLTSYATCLEPDILNMNPPWFFSLHESKALPLYSECFEGSNIEIIQKFNLDISKLIKIEGFTEDGWVKKDFHNKYLKKGSPLKIAKPEMWGRYTNVGKKELELRKEGEKKSNIVIEFIDHIDVDTHESKRYGETATIGLNSSNPVIGVVWMAQNQEAQKYNDLSNYTTDSNNLTHGKNPCITSQIMYVTSSRVSKRKHYHFDRIYPKLYFGHVPIDPGYNFYFWNDKPMNTRIGHSVVFKKVGPVKINSQIGDGTIKNDKNDGNNENNHVGNGVINKMKYLEEEEDNVKSTSPHFSPYAIMYTMKRLVLNSKQKGVYILADEMLYENYIKINGK